MAKTEVQKLLGCGLQSSETSLLGLLGTVHTGSLKSEILIMTDNDND